MGRSSGHIRVQHVVVDRNIAVMDALEKAGWLIHGGVEKTRPDITHSDVQEVYAAAMRQLRRRNVIADVVTVWTRPQRDGHVTIGWSAAVEPRRNSGSEQSDEESNN